ncbi:hypothetical protein CLTEP_16220 [Clostridium tepidiprofundi DSM 19306]|uniref:Uncharacterized protein n=1 Tax=Clostridium tepidiprofundi DSM 19306 TaxID=1121338 RepID=A0A151B3V5_9CLOT|nr:hypothetical protein [Clostridium tepidiprofundi]KYH34470.1 hypothetical protein CLTEP_16220 [Clostridium tepidiprofundi DSM 19306]
MRKLRVGYKILIILIILGGCFVIFHKISQVNLKDNNYNLNNSKSNIKIKQNDVKGNYNSVLNEFDVNYPWKEKGIDSKKVLVGSYDITKENGKNQMWIGKEASITLSSEKSFKYLNIKGWIPVSMHKKINNIQDVSIKFYINDKEIKQLKFKEDKLVNEKIEYEKIKDIIGDNKQFCFKIQVSSSYNPKKEGINDDERDLSMIIDYIGEKN